MLRARPIAYCSPCFSAEHQVARIVGETLVVFRQDLEG